MCHGLQCYANALVHCREFNIYALPLREYSNNEFSSPANPSVLLRYSLVDVYVVTFSIGNGIIAIVTRQQSDGPTPSQTDRILFLNSYTGADGWITPHLPEVTILYLTPLSIIYHEALCRALMTWQSDCALDMRS